jgi:hypothetical protein
MLDAGSVNCGFWIAECNECRMQNAPRLNSPSEFNGVKIAECRMWSWNISNLQSAIKMNLKSKIQNLKYRVLVLDQSILVSLEDEARWAMNERLTDKKEIPNYLDFIYVDALEQAKPETVTIIR